MISFDPKLRQILPTNNSNETIVLNKYFNDFEKNLYKHLANRDISLLEAYPDFDLNEISTYQFNQNIDLYNFCINHSKKYEQQICKKNIIALTHPLYMHYSHMHTLDFEQKEQANVYLERFQKFISLAPELKKDFDFILFETVHHYAAGTSLLLEEGIFNKVVFTQFDTGYFMDSNSLEDIGKANWFLGGGYNARCFLQSTIQILENSYNGRVGSEFIAIKDLILNHPNPSRRERKFIYGIIDPEDIPDKLEPCIEYGEKSFDYSFFPQNKILNLDLILDLI